MKGSEMSKSQFTWEGDTDRPLLVARPCPCGCDLRNKPKGWADKYVGYLTGADAKGNGVTIWVEDEKVFQRLGKLLGKIYK